MWARLDGLTYPCTAALQVGGHEPDAAHPSGVDLPLEIQCIIESGSSVGAQHLVHCKGPQLPAVHRISAEVGGHGVAIMFTSPGLNSKVRETGFHCLPMYPQVSRRARRNYSGCPPWPGNPCKEPQGAFSINSLRVLRLSSSTSRPSGGSRRVSTRRRCAFCCRAPPCSSPLCFLPARHGEIR